MLLKPNLVEFESSTVINTDATIIAAALLLAPRIGEHFDAIVTGASAKGTWVRIVKPATEGRVVRGYQGLDVGDHVRVQLVDVNVERGFIDFAGIAAS